MERDRMIKLLDEIAKDIKRDTIAFDGKPFTGRTVGTYFGYQGAAIAAIAHVVREIIKEMK